MLILILGVALWCGAHVFKRVMPHARADMGAKGRGPIAIALILSVVLMIIGYRMTDGPYWWGASAPLKGINNLLVLAAIYLFAAHGMKTRVTKYIRHPQLTGVALWATAHLLVNGDLPSFVLFGGLLLWACAEIVLINRAEPVWSKPAGPFPARKEVMAVIGAVIVILVLGLIHTWLGYNPFGA